MCVYLVPLLI